MTGTIVSVNVGAAVAAPYAGGDGRTAIDKHPVTGAIPIHRLGVEGNEVGNPAVHGGIEQAVYAYAREDAEWWSVELDRPISPGNFGENLTTEGIDVTGAMLGETWAIGSAVLQVTRPRIPCHVFAGFWDVPDLIKRFTRRAAPGAYLRVVNEGLIEAGDAVRILHRPDGGVTIGETFRALTLEPELLVRLVDAPGVPDELRARVSRRMNQ